MPQDYSYIIQEIKDWLLLNPNRQTAASVWDEFKQKIFTSYELNNQSFIHPIYNHALPKYEECTNFNNFIEEIKDVPLKDKYWLKAFREIFEKYNTLSWNVKVRRLNQQFDIENWQLNKEIDQIANNPNQYDEICWTKKNSQHVIDRTGEEVVKKEEETKNQFNPPKGFPLNVESNKDEKPKKEVVIIEKTTENEVEKPRVKTSGEEKELGEKKDELLPKTIPPLRKGRFFGTATIAAALVAVWYFWGGLLSPTTWFAKESMYSIANEVVIRSSPDAATDNNKMDVLNYGYEVKLLEKGDPWTKVKYNGKKGYVHSKYLINKTEHYVLKSALEDAETVQYISKARYKRAILSYFMSNDICGILPIEEQERIFGKGINKPQWSVKAINAADGMANWVRFDKRAFNANSSYPDMVFVVKSKEGVRKIVYYTFHEDETPILIDVQDYPYNTPIFDYWFYPEGSFGKDLLGYFTLSNEYYGD